MTSQEYTAIVILSIMKELRRQGHDDILYKYAQDRMGFSVADVDEDVPPRDPYTPKRIAGTSSMDIAFGLYAAHNSFNALKRYLSCGERLTEEQVRLEAEEIANVVDKYFDHRTVEVIITCVDENPNTIRM